MVSNYTGSIFLENVTFIVHRGAWARMKVSGHKNAHAFVEGDFQGWEKPNTLLPGVVRYDRLFGHFCDRDTGNQLGGCSMIYLFKMNNSLPSMEYMS